MAGQGKRERTLNSGEALAKMNAERGKNRGNLGVEDGGNRGTRAEIQLERDLRELFVALCGKDGKALNRNYANVANGHTRPWRVLVRRIKEAKALRAPDGYARSKQMAARLSVFVDELYDRHDTGEHRPAA